jgi:hypothetical protein
MNGKCRFLGSFNRGSMANAMTQDSDAQLTWVCATQSGRDPFFHRTRASTLPFMDEKLMVATEGLLKASLETLFRTLRSKRASRRGGLK